MFFKPAHIKAAQERRGLIKKVYHYRLPALAEGDRAALLALASDFQTALSATKDKAAQRTRLGVLMASSDKLLARTGGHYYRQYHFFENVETLVVAAILAIAIRSYFLQPFKIPTNSMWPTYHGMTYTIHGVGEAPPSQLQKICGLIFQGTTQHSAIAPASGSVTVPVFSLQERQQYRSVFRYQTVRGTMLGFIPVQQRQYTFMVDGRPASVTVPLEFSSMDKLLLEKFFPSGADLTLNDAGEAVTDTTVGAGDPIVSFQIESGDMLFVDRFTYHWVAPQVGHPIVFRTRAVPGLTAMNAGQPDDRYYIKRLVGEPGDILKIDGSTLLRNGHPITGSPIFDINSKKVAPYRGYEAHYDLADGATITVTQNQYYAFGDNSPESLDSRAWGGLPRDQVVGRAVFIYYPFTSRWGFSR